MESNLEETNATPDTGDASTLSPLDRIERMLSADDGSGETSQEASAESKVDPDGDGQQSDEPQLTTSDLAKLLRLDDGSLDLDEEGNAVFKTKVDGVEGAAKLQDLIKSYQLEGHVNKRSMELAERERGMQAKAQEVEQQFSQKLQYVERLNNIAAQQLMHEFQSINWQALEQQDPGTAALYRQKFQERHSQLQQVDHAIRQEKAQAEHKSQAEKEERLQKEAQRLTVLIPEWKDEAVANKEKSEIAVWAQKAGYDQSEMEALTSTARNVQLLRKAMLADRLQASKPDVENKVRTAPKLVKPGQPGTGSQEQSLRNLKQSVIKSGGKSGSIEEYLIATKRV